MHQRRRWRLFVLWKANPVSSLAIWNGLLHHARCPSRVSWIAFRFDGVSGCQHSDEYHSLGQYQHFDGQSEYSFGSHLASLFCSISLKGTHRAVSDHTRDKLFSSIPQIVSSTLPRSIIAAAPPIYHSTTLRVYFFSRSHFHTCPSSLLQSKSNLLAQLLISRKPPTLSGK